MPHTFEALLPTIAALIGVIGLVLVVGRTVRHLGLVRARSDGAARRLAVQDTLFLDRTRRLHLVRCDRREVLILSGGPGSDVVVGWLSAPESVA